jgi:hypothetical protein
MHRRDMAIAFAAGTGPTPVIATFGLAIVPL